MKKIKPRTKTYKPQNSYGGDYKCPSFERDSAGKEWCHDEYGNNWREYVKWSQIDENGKLKCKGNRHTCYKMKLKWLASLSEKERKKYQENL